MIITRAKLSVTFVIDLNSCKLLLNKLGGEISKLFVARVKVARKYTREGKYLRLLNSLELEIAIMETKWKGM